MTQDKISNDYFKWLYDLVCKERYAKEISFKKLLMHLHRVEFTYIIPMDKNRAENGLNMRYRFACEYAGCKDADLYLDGPCSILEMMVALATRCEEEIMDDPRVGNRTSQWFWGMIVNLGLGSMVDDRYDRKYVDEVIDRFLNREYEPDGTGGLFRIRNCKDDLRKVQIWHQLCWYLDSIT